MFGYTTIFVTACLITVGSAKGTRCRKCFDFGGKLLFHSHSTKNCEKPSSSECATSNYTCMEFVGTLDIKIILTTSMNITTRYCAVTNQTGCQKIDFADPNHDPTGIISEITTGMKKIPKLSTLFSIQNISGSVCVSGSKPEKKAITEVHSVSIASTPGSSIVSRITTDTTKIPDMSSVHSKINCLVVLVCQESQLESTQNQEFPLQFQMTNIPEVLQLLVMDGKL
ncbi:unnamed protein product [Mytilus edulis]|uniref:Uncharacterized protein n=1 Tax=Mytilus edulis TaxID=6550 RepID=A0A8S3PN00_MYTED|nr:unnamed protein product [Mytilus edulis]